MSTVVFVGSILRNSLPSRKRITNSKSFVVVAPRPNNTTFELVQPHPAFNPIIMQFVPYRVWSSPRITGSFVFLIAVLCDCSWPHPPPNKVTPANSSPAIPIRCILVFIHSFCRRQRSQAAVAEFRRYASGIAPHSYSGNSVGYPCSFLASITHVPSASMRRAYGVQTLPRMIPCRAGITSSLERTGASLAGSHVAGTLESGCISQPFVIAGRSVRSFCRLAQRAFAASLAACLRCVLDIPRQRAFPPFA
jgi:hypothetical protein